MRYLPEDFAAHLASGATTLCTCWLITRQDGERFGYTDHDRSLEIEGILFHPESGMTGSALQSSADMATDNATLEGVLSTDHMSHEDLSLGRYDDATISIWKVNWRAPEQRVLLKEGNFGEVTVTESGFSVEMRGISHRLSQTVGRRYQKKCDAVLGSAKCGVDLTLPENKTSATVLVSDGLNLVLTGSDNPSGWADYGTIRFESGAAAGVTYSIKTQQLVGEETRLTLRNPLPTSIAPGDMVSLFVGCNRKFKTCKDKFSNEINFRGFPHMPGNDAVTSYPISGEVNDGGRRS